MNLYHPQSDCVCDSCTRPDCGAAPCWGETCPHWTDAPDEGELTAEEVRARNARFRAFLDRLSRKPEGAPHV